MPEIDRVVLHAISTVIVVLIAIGLYFRNRRPGLHWRIMVTAFVMDISLVLVIELSRGAIEQAMEVREALLGFHIAVSVGVVVMYIVMFVIGRQLLLGAEHRRSLHRNAGIVFIVLRSLNYITSFMV